MESQTSTTHPDPAVAQTHVAPNVAPEVDHWLQLSYQAQDLPSALEYVERAAELNPDDPRVQWRVQQCVTAVLSYDAFVAFVAETDRTYVINFRNARPIVVPKARTQPERFPPVQRTEGERVLGMVWWLLLGLVPVGVGALILSPIVAQRAQHVIHLRNVNAREQRLAWVAFNLAGVFGLLGAFFTLLLVLHLLA